MNQPWIYMCSPSQSPLPPPSPSNPSGSSQCTSPEHLSRASNLGWWSVSPLIVYLFLLDILATQQNLGYFCEEKGCWQLIGNQFFVLYVYFSLSLSLCTCLCMCVCAFLFRYIHPHTHMWREMERWFYISRYLSFCSPIIIKIYMKIYYTYVYRDLLYLLLYIFDHTQTPTS